MSVTAPGPRTTQRPPRPGHTWTPPAGVRPVAPPARSGPTTPNLLRLLLAACVLTSLLFGASAVTQLLSARAATGAAVRNAAQLDRVQRIQSNLLHAHAIATNAFLVGGLESPEHRTEYTAALSAATRLIPEAGEAQPADRDALRELNDHVVSYAATMEQARATNRQGFPVGWAYLDDAGRQLQTGALPVLDSLVRANDARVGQSLRWNATVTIVLGVLALLTLAATMVVVARRFRRFVNVGLAAATALLLVALVTIVSTVGNVRSSVATVRDGSLQTARSVGIARGRAYEAKAYESLALIARDRGGANEGAWAVASLRARRALRAIPDGTVRTSLGDRFNDHLVSHRKIRAFDQDGRWDLARAEATGDGPDSSNATFARFDAEAARAQSLAQERTNTVLANQGAPLVGAAITALLATLAAAAAASRGIAARLREYA